MLWKTLPTTILQMFSEIILNSEAIIISIIDPDDNFNSINGLTHSCLEIHLMSGDRLDMLYFWK